jgi:hypothetical protein
MRGTEIEARSLGVAPIFDITFANGQVTIIVNND